MPITNPNILSEVETGIFNYFTDQFGDAEGVKAFRGHLPPQCYDIWMFEINSGGEPLDSMLVTNHPGNCGRWRMNAMVRGIFSERSNAQYLAGVVRTLVPTVENFIKNVHWLRPTGEPTFSSVDIDDGEGGVILCTQVEYPLEVIMKETGVS